MKKILAMATVAALAAGASAYAANPFSDVSTSDWAYQAISNLSDRGMIDGYPDGTFKGQQNITRFEMAQIIARLMAKEDQMDAEHRAIVDRLASEYGAELQNLGVRVGNLEKKVGNIVWTGDARLRYQRSGVADDDGTKEAFKARIRLDAHAIVNDSTYIHGRLSTGDVDLKNGGSANVFMDRLYVHHQFGKVGATLGRYELDFGQQAGGWLYANAFDGVEVAAPLGEKVNLALGYGRMKDARESIGDAFVWGVKDGTKAKDVPVTSDFRKAETFYAKLGADLKVAKIGIEYVKVSPYTYTGTWTEGEGKTAEEKSESVSAKKAFWGVNLLIPVNDFRIFGDYYADTKKNMVYGGQKGKIWTFGIGYGAKNLQKVGSYTIDLAYFKTKAGLYEVGMSGLQIPTSQVLFTQDGHFWLATGDVVVAKNTYVHGEYAFASKKDRTDEGADSWTLSLNYKF